MGLIGFIILMGIVFGGSKRDRRHSDIMKLFLIGCVLMGAGSVAVPFLSHIAEVAICLFVAYRVSPKFRDRIQRFLKLGPYHETPKPEPDPYYYQRPKEDPHPQQNRQASKAQPYQTQPVHSTILPTSARKRKKIVQAFNKKHELYLTEEQIKSIVDASYMSEAWKRELEAMTVHYETTAQWFQGGTKHIRAYVHAFHIQEISSDIQLQNRICFQAFEEVWSYADTLTDLTLDERIHKVNEKYYAKFDNITFMIAYRFLESYGHIHRLDTMGPISEEQELDELKRKYDQRSTM